MKNLIAICFVLFTSFVFAQNQKLNLEDAILKQRTSLAPERLNQLQWVKGTDQYAQIIKSNGNDLLQLSNAVKTKDPVLSIPLTDINQALRAKKIDTLNRYPTLEEFNKNTFLFRQKNNIVKYNWNNKKVEEIYSLDEKAENIDQSNSSGNIAYTIDNNLYIQTTDGKAVPISTDGNDGLVYGKSVHRDEYGISKGTYWNSTGTKLAFYRMDQSMVTNYPITNLDEHPATVKLIKYPMAGMKSHEVSIGIYDVATKTITYLKIGGPKDQYLTNIAWGPDSKSIYVAVLNRATNYLWMNAYTVSNGIFKCNVFTETDSIWVEPTHPIQFLKGDDSRIIWQSERSGHNHLYLYNLNSNELIRPLTFDHYDVLSVLSATKEKIYFTSTYQSPLENTLGVIDLKTFATKHYTETHGIHTFLLNESNGYVIDQYTNTTTPRVVNVLNSKMQVVKNLLTASNPLKNYAIGKIVLDSILASDGVTKLYTRMILPPNFDSTKKYPCITYVYNGPHVQLITNSWLGGADMWNYYMAQEGYILFTLDGRGSDHRGAAFVKGIHRQLGTLEIADQLAGNSYLRSLSFIDSNRLGIHGWSFGGFMTTSLMTRTAGKYKVGVGGGPVIDWGLYEIMYTERYMDTPEENPTGYKKANTLNYVDQLKGKLLLIHGTSDDVVVWQNSLLYQKKCVEKGIQADYFVYPGHLHNVLGKDRAHLMTKVSDYFKANL